MWVEGVGKPGADERLGPHREVRGKGHVQEGDGGEAKEPAFGQCTLWGTESTLVSARDLIRSGPFYVGGPKGWGGLRSEGRRGGYADN